jgi:branched-chain amino acid transport system permease protein
MTGLNTERNAAICRKLAQESVPGNGPYYVLFLIVAALPAVFSSQIFVLHLVNMMLHNVIVLIGFIIILGFSKQFSLGQVAFYGIGAYALAYFTKTLGMSFLPALVLSSGFAALLSLLVAIPGTRFSGPWLALVTYAFAEIARILFSRLKPITGGFAGFSDIPKPQLFGIVFDNEFAYFYLFLAVTVIAVIFARRLRIISIGKRWIAIGDNENLAKSIGINPFTQKIFAFMAGSFFAGISGALYAGYVGYISPEMFTINYTLFFLTILVVGGLESIEGGIIATLIFTFSQNYLRSLYPWDMVFYGLIIVVFINFIPQGIGEVLKSGVMRLLKSRRGNPENPSVARTAQ